MMSFPSEPPSCGWRQLRLKHVAYLVMGQSPPSEYYNNVGVGLPFLQGNADFGEESPTPRIFCPRPSKKAQPGDLLLSVRAPVGQVNVADREYGIGRGLCAIRPNQEFLDKRFGWYVLQVARGQLMVEAAGSTYEAVAAHDVRNLTVLLPESSGQRTLVDFLDRETAKIDRLIEEKQILIDLLEEKRTALITQAVTKGLDPDVGMKESGVEWLGEIPAHWRIAPLHHLTERGRPIMYGIVLPGPNVPEGVPIVKGGDVKPGRLRLEKLNRTTFEIESRYVRSRLRGGDLVYAIRGSIGEVERVPVELSGANLTQDAARISVHPEISADWLLFALRSRPLFAQLEAGAMGATIRGINIRDLKRVLIAVPPRPEQEMIAASLDEATRTIGNLVEEIAAGIDLLREYRTALVSAAVTGKIDVREEAA